MVQEMWNGDTSLPSLQDDGKTTLYLITLLFFISPIAFFLITIARIVYSAGQQRYKQKSYN